MLKLIFLAALAGFSAASDVIEFTDADFESKIGGYELILVEFYAPWCGHCKRLAPEYEKAATDIKSRPELRDHAALAKVDCTANADTCSKYGVTGYPTLKLFRNGEESGSYDGPRSADGIVSTLKKQAGPASMLLQDEKKLNELIGGSDATIVGFFADDKSSAHEEFHKAANTLREKYRFAHTYSIKHGDKDETIVIFRPGKLKNKFEDQSVEYDEEKITSNKIKRFIQDNVLGICPVMTEDNRDQLTGKDLLVAYFNIDYALNPSGSNYWRNRVMKVAKTFLDQGRKLNFAVADKNQNRHSLTEFGLESDAVETPMVTIKTAKGAKYVMKETFSMDTMTAFLNEYFDGQLKAYLKSEPVPESNDGPVKVVVAENFDSIVNDDSKDVLIEFYAPWCGHCKNLEPKYKELGEKLADDPNVVIAKMDATANDVPPQYEVSGFPTIYFAPAGSKMSPKKYEGGREVSDFISYLKREATNSLVMQEEPKKKKKKKDDDKVEL